MGGINNLTEEGRLDVVTSESNFGFLQPRSLCDEDQDPMTTVIKEETHTDVKASEKTIPLSVDSKLKENAQKGQKDDFAFQEEIKRIGMLFEGHRAADLVKAAALNGKKTNNSSGNIIKNPEIHLLDARPKVEKKEQEKDIATQPAAELSQPEPLSKQRENLELKKENPLAAKIKVPELSEPEISVDVEPAPPTFRSAQIENPSPDLQPEDASPEEIQLKLHFLGIKVAITLPEKLGKNWLIKGLFKNTKDSSNKESTGKIAESRKTVSNSVRIVEPSPFSPELPLEDLKKPVQELKSNLVILSNEAVVQPAPVLPKLDASVNKGLKKEEYAQRKYKTINYKD